MLQCANKSSLLSHLVSAKSCKPLPSFVWLLTSYHSEGDAHRHIRRNETEDDFAVDLTHPASWFPHARTLRRRIIAHMGPTNSGKTFQALQALKAAPSGIYCGPLRLLAWEVAEKMNGEGLPCNLVTGQERRILDGSRHVASTVEMANLSQRIKVGVIDEVQMLGDTFRGPSFTRAVLGLPAEELHLCGDPAILPLLRALAKEAGDSFEVRTYSRLAALRVGQRVLPEVSMAQRGDCLVAFSRKDVHQMKRQVEGKGQHSCCVVYGALPPQSRAHQAILFNTIRTGYNVLAASDAVGMGLNLNIRRIVFSSFEKFDGKEMRPLTPAEVKQIAGRAGRYGSKYHDGVVTCLHAGDLPFLKEAMAAENPVIQRAAIFPSFEQIAMLAHQDPSLSLAKAIELYAERAILSRRYFLGDCENMLSLALMLEPLPLPLRECHTFALSPTDSAEPSSTGALLSFAKAYCRRKSVPGWMAGHLPGGIPGTEAQLKNLEALHSVYDLYVWLSYRFEDCFPDREDIEILRLRCSESIAKGLESLGRQKKSTPKKAERLQADHPLAPSSSQTPNFIRNVSSPE